MRFLMPGCSRHKFNADGSITQTISASRPQYPVFDGTNIWVPGSGSESMIIVRVKDAVGNPLATPFVVATLTGNGLSGPYSAGFDGERILVTNTGGESVSLWKAVDFSPLGSYSVGKDTGPAGVCSDGLNFWIGLGNTNKVVRF
jgi:hypothetical protein